MVLGIKYPTVAFYTGGVGQSIDGVPNEPCNSFCRQAALAQAKIENFNLCDYKISSLPKELFGKIYPIEKVEQFFKQGGVLETYIASAGASVAEHKAIVTGLGVCWGKDEKDQLVGGWVAQYCQYFDTWIDDEIATAHSQMWLNKSLNNKLSTRGIQKDGDFQLFHNFVNIEQTYGYCLTALGFLDFEFAEPATVE